MTKSVIRWLETPADIPERGLLDAKLVQRLQRRGYRLGIRTHTTAPRSIIDAALNVSRFSQRFLLTTWLAQYVRDGVKPRIDTADEAKAQAESINLHEELHRISSWANEAKQIVCEPEARNVVDRAACERLQKQLHLVARVYAARVLVHDVTTVRTEVAQRIIKVLFFIGPVAHWLEELARGWGKVFAASVDDLLTEAAEITALRSSGFSWPILARRLLIVAPMLVTATVLALGTNRVFDAGNPFLAGVLFGLAAVALSLTTAIQSIFLFHSRTHALERDGKLEGGSWKSAIIQDFTNPARLGLFIGAAASPLVAGLTFWLAPGTIHNGWVLALLGSIETLVAGLTVFSSRHLLEIRYREEIIRLRVPRKSA